MKLSNKGKHFAPRKKLYNSKNFPRHRSHGGLRYGKTTISAAGVVRLLFGAMSRRVRRVFIQQEQAIKQTGAV